MNISFPTILVLIAAPLAMGAADVSKLPPAARKEGVTYAKDIRPILETSCFRCHGNNDRPKAGLRLDSLEGVLKGSKEGKVIVPGKSQESLLVIAVARIDEEKAMPPKPRGGPRGGQGQGRPGGGAPPGAPPGGPNPGAPGQGGQGPGGPGMGPMPKPLTAEQVGLVRAWIDQGAK